MKNFWKIYFILLTLMLLIIIPNTKAEIKAGETLRDLKNQLTALQNKKKENENKKKKTKAEIEQNKKDMENAEQELFKTKEQVQKLQVEIENTNEELENKKKESEKLLVLYQMLESDNVYMEYVTGASTMTELIMRMDAVKQLSEYNNQQLSELEMLISNNNKMNKELDKYQVELDKKIVEYEAAIEELGDEYSELVLGGVSIDDEIANAKNIVKYYEDLGCKDDQELLACVDIANNKGWVKPISKGRITSLFGLRFHPTQHVWKNHNGIDISTAEGTKVYATAAGQVGAIVEKSSCGGNMVYIWTYVNGKAYTYVFMHLLQINVKVGQKVDINTVIGLSGGGRTAKKNGGYDTCTTGAHLHYGLAAGYHFGKDKPLNKFNSYLIEPPGYPGLYQWFYSRY